MCISAVFPRMAPLSTREPMSFMLLGRVNGRYSAGVSGQPPRYYTGLGGGIVEQ